MSSSMMLSPVFGNSFNLSIYFMKSESSWGWTARHRLPDVGLMSMSMRALDISTKDILAMALGKVGRDLLWKLVWRIDLGRLLSIIDGGGSRSKINHWINRMRSCWEILIPKVIFIMNYWFPTTGLSLVNLNTYSTQFTLKFCNYKGPHQK
jgi:hypothetical protein